MEYFSKLYDMIENIVESKKYINFISIVFESLSTFFDDKPGEMEVNEKEILKEVQYLFISVLE